MACWGRRSETLTHLCCPWHLHLGQLNVDPVSSQLSKEYIDRPWWLVEYTRSVCHWQWQTIPHSKPHRVFLSGPKCKIRDEKEMSPALPRFACLQTKSCFPLLSFAEHSLAFKKLRESIGFQPRHVHCALLPTTVPWPFYHAVTKTMVRIRRAVYKSWLCHYLCDLLPSPSSDWPISSPFKAYNMPPPFYHVLLSLGRNNSSKIFYENTTAIPMHGFPLSTPLREAYMEVCWTLNWPPSTLCIPSPYTQTLQLSIPSDVPGSWSPWHGLRRTILCNGLLQTQNCSWKCMRKYQTTQEGGIFYSMLR